MKNGSLIGGPSWSCRSWSSGIIFGDFKKTVYPFFESDALFLEGCFVVLCLVV